MSKHTPGPWFAVRNCAYWEVNPSNAGNGVPWTVADICPSSPGNPDGGLQEANARLIAAAPELLNALEDFVMACNIPGEPELGVEVQMAFRQADALLERLKGKV